MKALRTGARGAVVVMRTLGSRIGPAPATTKHDSGPYGKDRPGSKSNEIVSVCCASASYRRADVVVPNSLGGGYRLC